MDKTILKNFAVESRKDLMDKIERKISLYYVDENFDKSINGDIVVLSNDKHSITLTKEQSNNRDNLVRRIHELGLGQVIEESAYTWFNRLVAIRYMEINDYLPLTKDNQSLGFRVLSSQDNTLDPEILKFTNLSNTFLDIDFNPNKYNNLTNSDEKFKYVLLLVCKKLGKVIPQVFDGVTDYIDLLVPDNLLSNGSVLDKLIKIPEDNFKEVEVIGWLYQFYVSYNREEYRKKKVITKKEIPTLTQIFTPDWIVKYMVENSLGRYWIEHGGDESLINNWEYFIKDNVVKHEKKILPTEIKCIDPCSGSGHILVYMFEVLFQIYESAGYSKNEIPELILQNNLNGLDIDDRAGQLSVLSVLLKAREYDKNIFNKDIVDKLKIQSIQEIVKFDKNLLEELNNKEIAYYLIDNFKNAKEIGSLLKIEMMNYDGLTKEIESNDTIFKYELSRLLPIINAAKILSNKYNVLVTNPPYMGITSLPQSTKEYLTNNYPNSKSDLYSMFIDKQFVEEGCYEAMVTPDSWLFLVSFIKLREYFINNINISSLIHIGTGAFDAAVQTCSFVFKHEQEGDNPGIYYDLTNCKEKSIVFMNQNLKKYYTKMSSFDVITGHPFAYWISDIESKIFKESNKKVCEYINNEGKNVTTNNEKYILNFWEVANDSIGNDKKWWLCATGGLFRKWYGNVINIIDWSEKSRKFYRENSSARIIREEFWNLPGITWGKFGTNIPNFRLLPSNYMYQETAILQKNEKDSYLILAILNSQVINSFLHILNPTINFQLQDISNIPLPYISEEDENILINISKECVKLSKKDWDSFEISWDFKRHPLLGYHNDMIGLSFNNWENDCNNIYGKLELLEKELNKKIYLLYGIDNYNINNLSITVRKADKLRDIKSFISYAVGCMFGRYSLDEEGLIYAGGEWDKSKYRTFIPDNDNIIPIADNNDIFYSDDIVGKFIKFVEITFGKDTLRENLDYIAETLGRKGIETSEETIRRYFLNDFYKDHLQTYQKRPIYWMFDSGKSNGFKCLIYMHRYNEQTISKIKVDYFLKVQESYRNQLAAVQERLNGVNGLTTPEIKELRNKEKYLTDKLKECKDYYEKLDHIANEMIKIDLDDGVKVNYAKFEDILAKIK